MEDSESGYIESDDGYETDLGASSTEDNPVVVPRLSTSDDTPDEHDLIAAKAANAEGALALQVDPMVTNLPGKEIVESIMVIGGGASTIAGFVSAGFAAPVALTLAVPFAFLAVAFGTYNLATAIAGVHDDSLADELELAYSPMKLGAYVVSDLAGKDKVSSMRNANIVNAIASISDGAKGDKNITSTSDVFDMTIMANDYFEGFQTIQDEKDLIKSSLLP